MILRRLGDAWSDYRLRRELKKAHKPRRHITYGDSLCRISWSSVFNVLGVLALLLLIAAVAVVLRIEGQRGMHFASSVPSNASELLRQEPGRSLNSLGYFPVDSILDPDQDEDVVIGHVYVVCGSTELGKCSEDRHLFATNTRPNLYVINGRVVLVEGVRSGPHRSYVHVPADMADLSVMNEQRRDALFALPELVSDALSTDGSVSVYSPEFGVVRAERSSGVTPRSPR